MGQALYRKYRSRSFDEVVGQDHIVKTLRNALKNGRVSHAYLFTGPKGVGKTSVARILAHEVNGLDYDDESIHLDIIEIDAASNRRIDEIRELRERVHIAPTSAKYKVYIVDEVHMLTREAFNALLKTLEEPPAHCIFILATTEAHKLPETIVSRTQRFNFKPIEGRPAAEHLRVIAKKEKIDIEPAALELIAEHGSGSFRDSIGLLDQLSGLGTKITTERAREFLGLPPASAIKGLLLAIESGDLSGATKNLEDLRGQGVDSLMVAKALNESLRSDLLAGKASTWAVKLLRRLSAVGGATDPQNALEIDVLEAASANQPPVAAKLAPMEPPQEPLMQPQPVENESLADEDPSALERQPTAEFSIASWPEIIAKAKTDAPSLYTALRLAEPRLADGTLTLAFQFPLHQKKVVQAKNIDTLGAIIESLTGSKVKIECVVDKKLKLQPKKPAPEIIVPDSGDSAPLQTISNIFGAAEMLES